MSDMQNTNTGEPVKQAAAKPEAKAATKKVQNYIFDLPESYDFSTPQLILLLNAAKKNYNGGKAGTFTVKRRDFDAFLETLTTDTGSKAAGLDSPFKTRQKVTSVFNFYAPRLKDKRILSVRNVDVEVVKPALKA